MSVDLTRLLEEQRQTNRLIKLLIRATLTATANPLVQKPRTRVIKDTDFTTAQLTIAPSASLTVLDLPEKPDTDVDIGFFIALSTINSNKVRHTLKADGGRNRPFNFNATQQELGAAGFTAPNVFPLWTPLAAGVAGNFTVVYSSGLPGISLHRKIQIVLKNEDTVNAVIQSNGLFIAAYEYDQATKDIFAQVLGDTDPEQASSAGQARPIEDIPP